MSWQKIDYGITLIIILMGIVTSYVMYKKDDKFGIRIEHIIIDILKYVLLAALVTAYFDDNRLLFVIAAVIFVIVALEYRSRYGMSADQAKKTSKNEEEKDISKTDTDGVGKSDVFAKTNTNGAKRVGGSNTLAKTKATNMCARTETVGTKKNNKMCRKKRKRRH